MDLSGPSIDVKLKERKERKEGSSSSSSSSSALFDLYTLQLMMKTLPKGIKQQTPIRKQGKDPLTHLKGGSGATIIKRADLIRSFP